MRFELTRKRAGGGFVARLPAGKEKVRNMVPGRLAGGQRVIHCAWCGRSHRSWRALAACRWQRGLLWVQGNPPAGGGCWAVVSTCGASDVTVTLWSSQGEALAAKAAIDTTGCCGGCSGQHTLFDLAAEVFWE
jgi:hypothetical protein